MGDTKNDLKSVPLNTCDVTVKLAYVCDYPFCLRNPIHTYITSAIEAAHTIPSSARQKKNQKKKQKKKEQKEESVGVTVYSKEDCTKMANEANEKTNKKEEELPPPQYTVCEQCLEARYCSQVCRDADNSVNKHFENCVPHPLRVKLPPKCKRGPKDKKEEWEKLDFHKLSYGKGYYRTERYKELKIIRTPQYQRSSSDAAEYGMVSKEFIRRGQLIWQEPPIVRASPVADDRPIVTTESRRVDGSNNMITFVHKCFSNLMCFLLWRVLDSIVWRANLKKQNSVIHPLRWLRKHNFHNTKHELDMKSFTLTEFNNNNQATYKHGFSDFFKHIRTDMPHFKHVSDVELITCLGVLTRYKHSCDSALTQLNTHGVALYQWAGLLNHSCKPNCLLIHTPHGARLYALDHIQSYEELTIRYRQPQTIADFAVRCIQLNSPMEQQLTEQLGGGECLCQMCHPDCIRVDNDEELLKVNELYDPYESAHILQQFLPDLKISPSAKSKIDNEDPTKNDERFSPKKRIGRNRLFRAIYLNLFGTIESIYTHGFNALGYDLGCDARRFVRCFLHSKLHHELYCYAYEHDPMFLVKLLLLDLTMSYIVKESESESPVVRSFGLNYMGLKFTEFVISPASSASATAAVTPTPPPEPVLDKSMEEFTHGKEIWITYNSMLQTLIDAEYPYQLKCFQGQQVTEDLQNELPS